MNIATFKVRKKELLSILKKFKTLEKRAKKKNSTLEITMINKFLRLNIPGIEVPIAATTDGAAKFTMSLAYFTSIIETQTEQELEFILTDGELKTRSFAWRVPTTFFDTDRILRSINLPLNHTHLDVARLYLSEKYTTEEIEFNNLGKEVTEAIDKLKSDIDKTSSILKKYGFARSEVEQIITEKLRN